MKEPTKMNSKPPFQGDREQLQRKVFSELRGVLVFVVFTVVVLTAAYLLLK